LDYLRSKNSKYASLNQDLPDLETNLNNAIYSLLINESFPQKIIQPQIFDVLNKYEKSPQNNTDPDFELVYINAKKNIINLSNSFNSFNRTLDEINKMN